jgi:hypothetical protein
MINFYVAQLVNCPIKFTFKKSAAIADDAVKAFPCKQIYCPDNNIRCLRLINQTNLIINRHEQRQKNR